MVNCVYIHIPFCEKKCKYCAFCSYETLLGKDEYIKALIKEIKFLYKGEKLKTLYFGGGTPSILDIKDIESIINCFNIDNKTQITLEANPNSLTKEKLSGYFDLKINRLSLGVQSFDDNLLKALGRIHDRKKIYEAADNIKKAGFKNYSIDLMYGIPNQTTTKWEKTLDEALGLDIPHISLYGLKIEKGTYFYKNKPKNIASFDIQAKMYEIALDKLKENYIHYEFSNFAKNKEYFSFHNLCYWKREHYYGFGLNASGFIENKRYTNTKNLKKYIENPNKKNYKPLSLNEQIEEEIFLGLRLYEGINIKKLNAKYNIDIYKKYEKTFDKFISTDFMGQKRNNIFLTKKGILVSNEILCEFIDV